MSLPVKTFFPAHIRKVKGKRAVQALDAIQQIHPETLQAPEGREARIKPKSQLRGQFSLTLINKSLWFKVLKEIQLFPYKPAEAKGTLSL